MFAFLRKTRKTLIASNSIQKYVLYAIGEIFLVMVGILLALQVNNWNQDRIEREEEQLIYKRLIQDLEDDLRNIDRSTFNYQERLICGAEALRQLDSPNLDKVISWKTYKNLLEKRPELMEFKDLPFGVLLFNILKITLFYQTDNTFQELVSSGNIDLIADPALKKEIQSYYPQIKRSQEFQDQIIFTVQSNYRNVLQNNRISYLNQQSLEEMTAEGVDKKELMVAIENFLSLTRGFLTHLSTGDDSMKNQTQNLIDRIRANLK